MSDIAQALINLRIELLGRLEERIADLEAERQFRSVVPPARQPGKFHCCSCQRETEKRCETCKHWNDTGNSWENCNRTRCFDNHGLEHLLRIYRTYWCPDWEGKW